MSVFTRQYRGGFRRGLAERGLARERYEAQVWKSLRDATKLAPQAIPECPEGVRLVMLAAEHVRHAGEWSLNWSDNFTWWQEKTRRFGCAILVHDELCGLAMGTLSDQKTCLSITMIEGNPDPAHSLKGRILDIVELAGIIFAQRIGAAELRLINPLDGVLAYYLDSGFTFIKGNPNYCMKRVQQ